MKTQLRFCRVLLVTVLISAITLANAQNVGIGTVTPLEKLHVNGYIRSNPLSSGDTSLVIADQLGTLRIFPFPNDSTQVLRGNATWGQLPANAFGSFSFPDGVSGITPINKNQLQSIPYVVPAGKNLYITNIYSIRTDDFLSVSGLRVHYGFSNRGFTDQAQHLSNPIIAAAGATISSNADTLLINGFLINATVSPVTLSNLNTATYTVPVGRILVIANLFSLGTTSGLTINGKRVQYGLSSYGAKDQFQHLGLPMILNAGDVLGSNDNAITVNGYLRFP